MVRFSSEGEEEQRAIRSKEGRQDVRLVWRASLAEGATDGALRR
jgi:hypothetical protein